MRQTQFPKQPPRRLLPRRPPGRPRELQDEHAFTVRFESSDYRRVQRMAKRDRISMSHLIRLLVRRHVPQELGGQAAPPVEPMEVGTGTVLAVRLNAQEHAHLKRVAQTQGVPMSELTRLALRQYGLLPGTAAPETK